MDGQGFSREVAFSQSVINIGADQGNDIVLRGSSVADFHVLMHYDSGRWSISSLNGAYRTTVNGRSLDVEGTVLQNGSIVEIGTYRLTMMLNGVNTDIIIQSQSGADVSMSSDNIDADQNIQLEITKMDQTELEAGSAVEMELTVTNAGPLVANMQLQLQGIPSAWVQIIPPVLNLNEGRKGTFLVRISPPRNSSAQAGLYNMHFVAISPNYPRNTGIADTALTILPYSEFLISGPAPMQLKLSRGKQTDIADVVVINSSNATGNFFIQSRDDSNELNFAYQKTGSGGLAAGQEVVTVRPGDSVQIPMEITAKKIPLLGVSSKHHHYYTNVTPSDRPGDAQTIAGEVVIHPTINTMVLLLILALLIIAVGFIFQPYIHQFECQDGRRSQVIVAGSAAQLNWNVSGFASTITLNNGQTDTEVSNSGSQYVNPTVSTTYTLTAENFISSLLHLTHKKTVQVLVVPSRPAIDVFSVDKGKALYDETVTLNWSVEPNATAASITSNKSTTQLAPENYTGKLAQGYQTDTLISLKAQNDSGYDLKSLFINVASDAITLNKFTVWVRPNGIAIPEDNDVRRTTRWGSLQMSAGTVQPARSGASGVNPQPAAQSNTLEIPDNFNSTGAGTQLLNPEVMAASGQTMPAAGSYSYQPPAAGSSSASAELLVSPALNPTPTPVPTAAVPEVAADSVIARSSSAPVTSPEGSSSNRDFTIKLAEVIEDPLADSGYRVIEYYPNYVLQKQEQILVEWSVDGVPKVKIENLSGDDLQNTGGEYAYPEKSTTYTLNAQVGETKKAYSLPVNVAGDPDDGEGSGLKCELKANAATLKVPGSVMLTWTGGGNNRVQLISSTQAEKENDEAEKKKEEEAKAKGEKYEKPKDQALSGGTIGDYLQPSGFMRVNVDKQTTFVLNVYDASNNVICTKSVEVKYEGGNDKKDIKLKITKIADENGVSQPVYGKGQMVSYTVALTDFVKGTDPTGAIAITDGTSTCSVNWPVNTCSFQAKKTGELTITAVYAGDDVYKKATATAKEIVIDKMPTSIQINSAIKPAADRADVDVELLWDAKHSYGMVPTGIVTLTAGSTSCDVDMNTETMTCAGVVEIKTVKDDGSISISVKNMGLKDATPDRVTAAYKGDAYFLPSTSQSVLFFKIPTSISITEAYKTDYNHANVKALLSWDDKTAGGRLPTGTLKYTVGTGSCTLEIETRKLSCANNGVTVSDNRHNYSVIDMLLDQDGVDRISVEYSGDSLFNASTSTKVLFDSVPTKLVIDEAEKTSTGLINSKLTLSWEVTPPDSLTPGKTIKLVLSSGNTSNKSSSSTSTEYSGANAPTGSTVKTESTDTDTSGASCTLLITDDDPKFTDCEGEVSVKIENNKRIYEIINLDMGSSKGDTLKAEYSGDGTFLSSTSLPAFFTLINTELEITKAYKSGESLANVLSKLSWKLDKADGKRPTGTITYTVGSGTCVQDLEKDSLSCKNTKTEKTYEEDKENNTGDYASKLLEILLADKTADRVTAAYSGDSVFAPSTSQAVLFDMSDTLTEITQASKSPDGKVSLNLKIDPEKIHPDGLLPLGTIKFTSGSKTCTLDTGDDPVKNPDKIKLTDCKGKVVYDAEAKTYKITDMEMGDKAGDTISAVYSGDSAYYKGSTSPTVSFGKADTELTLESDSVRKEAADPMFVNLSGVLSWKRSDLEDKNIPIDTKPTGTITFYIGTDIGDPKITPYDTCKLDLGTMNFGCAGEDTDIKKVTSSEQLELILKKILLSKDNIGADRVKAVYSGDTYFNPSESLVSLFKKLDPKLKIVKITDEEGKEHQWYAPGQTVIVEFDIATGATGKVKLSVDTATCEVELPQRSCKMQLAKVAGVRTTQASYGGDANYFSGTAEKKVTISEPKELNIEIVKTMDKEGVEQEKYGQEEKVTVEIRFTDYDTAEEPTGPVTITVDTTDTEICPSSNCTCTINNYPEENSCEMIAPAKKYGVDDDGKVTGHLKAEYAGNTYYKPASADPYLFGVNGKTLQFKIQKITNQYGGYQPYFAYDYLNKISEENKQKIIVTFALSADGGNPSGNIVAYIEDENGAKKYCSPNPVAYPGYQTCEFSVSNIFADVPEEKIKMGAYTINAHYEDPNDVYVSRDTNEEVIIEKMIKPIFMLFPAYRLLPESNNKGEFEFYLSDNSDLPESYDVSMYVDKTKDPYDPSDESDSPNPSTWTYQTVNFTYGSGTYTCAFTSEAGQLKCYVNDPTTLDDPTITKDDDFYDITNASLTDMGASEVKSVYNGNTYFYAAEDTSNFYTDIGGYTQIDLKDLLKLNNESGSFNPRTFFTAIFSYNQKVEKVLPKGKMLLTLGTTTSECAFDLSGDLSEGKKFECGTLKQVGKRIEFIFENISVLNSTSSVKVKFVPSDTNYIESEAIEEFTPEAVPNVSIDKAQKTASYKADVEISVTGMGPLTKKYEVYQYLLLSSKAKEEDPDSRTCKLILYPSLQLEGSGCDAFPIKKVGDTYSLTHFQGIIEAADKSFSAALMNEYTTNPFTEGEFPKDAATYSYKKIATSLEVTDPLKYHNTHAFLSFNIVYDEEAADEYGVTPTGFLTLRTKSDDGADNRKCTICLSADNCPVDLAPFCDDYGDQSRYAHFVIDQSAGTAHWELQNVYVSEWRTLVSLEYAGDTVFENTSTEYEPFTKETASLTIKDAIQTSDSIYTTVTLNGISELTDKYIRDQYLRFQSNDGNKQCDYSLVNKTFTGGCTADSVTRKGDTFTVKNLKGILTAGDTDLTVSFPTSYLEESEYAKAKVSYNDYGTTMQVVDGLRVGEMAYLTAVMSFDVTPRDSYDQEPTGTITLISQSGGEARHCDFDLLGEGFSCGSLSRNGNEVIFIIEDLDIGSSGDTFVTVNYDGDDFYSESDPVKGTTVTEKAEIKIHSAKKTNKNNHAYMAFTINELGPLSQKYGVYPEFRFGSIDSSGSRLTCDIDRTSLAKEKGDCTLGSIERKESSSGDLIIIQDVSGLVLGNAEKYFVSLLNGGSPFWEVNAGITNFSTSMKITGAPVSFQKIRYDYNVFVKAELSYDADQDIQKYYADLYPTGTVRFTEPTGYVYYPTIGRRCSDPLESLCTDWTFETGKIGILGKRIQNHYNARSMTVSYDGDNVFPGCSSSAANIKVATGNVSISSITLKSPHSLGFTFTLFDGFDELINYGVLESLAFRLSNDDSDWSTLPYNNYAYSLPGFTDGSWYGGYITKKSSNPLTYEVSDWLSTYSSDPFVNRDYLWVALTGPYFTTNETRPMAHVKIPKTYTTSTFSAAPVSIELSLGQ